MRPIGAGVQEKRPRGPPNVRRFYPVVRRIDVAVGEAAMGYGPPAATGAVANAVKASDDATSVSKTASGFFASAAKDAKFLEEEGAKTNSAVALAQLAADVLLHHYCVVFNGDLQENYQCTFRNSSSNTVYWQYRYTTGATISLRCPKGKTTGGILQRLPP